MIMQGKGVNIMSQKMWKGFRNQRGFTLVELLVVIAIIGVLAAIAVPKFSDATATANGAKVVSELRMIDSAIVQVAAGSGKAPESIVIGDLVADTGKMYTKETWPKPPASGKVIVGGVTFAAAADDAYTITAGRAIYKTKKVEDLLAGK
jgi:prepilin-type N-terminal cleavage/methylation domain-containing protein